MEKIKRKFTAFFMAALIIMMLPVTQAKAATFSKTKDDAVAWCKSLIDKPGEDVDSSSGVQCVDLVRKYTQWLGKDIGRCSINGIAADYATQSIPTDYYTRYGNNVKPEPGDIFVWKSNNYGAGSSGHVGVIYEVGSNYYKYIDYAPSRGTTAQQRGAKGNTKKDGLYNFDCIIRPHFKEHTHSYTGHSVSKVPTATTPGQWTFTCSCGAAQYVEIPALTESDVKPGKYKFEAVCAPGKYIGIAPGTFTSGTNVALYAENEAKVVFDVIKNDDGTYIIQHSEGNNTLNIDLKEGLFEENVMMWEPDSNKGNQRWYIVPAGNGEYRITSKVTYCNLDVLNGVNTSGTNIWTYRNNGARPQLFKLVRVSCDVHSWNDGEVTRNATEYSEGEMLYTCKVCGDTKKEVIPKIHYHDYEIAERKEATCIEDAITTIKCKECGDTYTVKGDVEFETGWSEVKPETSDTVVVLSKTQYSSADKQSGWEKVEEGDIDYAASAWGGFDTTNALYSKYNKQPLTAGENGDTKIEVTTSNAGYIYWHWCQGAQLSQPDNRYVYSNKDTGHTTFHAFYSTDNLPLDTNANARKLSNASYCKDTYWWLDERIEIKRCHYVKYKKSLTAGSEWSEWQDSNIAPSETTDVRTRTLYSSSISLSGKAKGHNYVTDVKKATTKADGSISSKCSVCGDVQKTDVIYRIDSVSLSKKSYIYTGSVHVPDVIVKDSKGNVIDKSNYTLTYSDSNSKKTGSYNVKVEFTGNYEGTEMLQYGIYATAEDILDKSSDDDYDLDIDYEDEEDRILSDSKDESPKWTGFSLLQLRYTSVKKDSIKLKWSKVRNADKYVLYGAPCGEKYKKIGNYTKTSATIKKLKAGKYYKYYVVAVYSDEGKDKVLAGSKTIHIATNGKKIGNYKKVTVKNVKKGVLTIKKGKSFTLKTKEVAESGKKVNRHRKIAFESSNPSVASVSSSGKIKAKAKGTCYIYAYSQSGTYAKVKVKVK